ncbi:DUF1304 domain-containing protein [Glycomyces sp. L485]|uniref:DUF1304 family protein n=1 Tax=Glycomyces sp. L485 TaxID=2909235 RepID=UPI001F4AA47A|nr:DUF1304 domain-containing protein [Glycomyces sp. L485]MCH7230394.1 DUF1304 domain-containing protein [Glycomyces sp. L485]
MLFIVQAFAFLAAALHVYIWVMERLRFGDPKIHGGVFGAPSADVDTVRSWAFNQGFYNLFLAVGAFVVDSTVGIRATPVQGTTSRCSPDRGPVRSLD